MIRIGLLEMIRFCQLFFTNSCKYDTFFESCGVADLITTCYGGRNRRLSEAFVKTGKPIEVLERELLNGQKWEGFLTSEAMVRVLTKRGYADSKFICAMIFGQLPVK